MRLARRAASVIGDFAEPVGGELDAPPIGEVVYSLLLGTGIDGRTSYSLYRDDRYVLESHDSRAVVGQLLWEISSDTVELADGYLLIHAGAVVTPEGGAVLILGESGSGKTTLVAALVQEGFGYLSDEAGAIDLDIGLAHPWPRPLGFTLGTRSLGRFSSLFAPEHPDVEGSTTEKLYVGIVRIRAEAIADPCSVRHVIDHHYEEGAASRAEPLSRATALVKMGSAAPRLRHEGDRGLSMLGAVMRGATAYTLVSGDLEDAVRAVRELVTR